MNTLRQCRWLLLVALVPALLACGLHPKRPVWSWSRPGVDEVELDEANRLQSPVLWVDARPARAYNERHVPQAVSLNEDNWEEGLAGFLAAWHPGAKVIVYCGAGECGASQEVAARLKRELQVEDIHVLRGGWATWQQRHP